MKLLAILEALFMKEEKPAMNLQYEELFVLPTLKRPKENHIITGPPLVNL